METDSRRTDQGASSSAPGRHRSYTAWSAAESEQLRTLVATYGCVRKWNLIASHMPGRSGKQCRDRWVNHIKDGTNVEVWTPEEDFLLAFQHSVVGSKWSTIARMLPGRTATSIKNHWNSTCRSKTLANRRSLLCAYTTLLHSGKSAEAAFNEAVTATRQKVLFTELKTQLEEVTGTVGYEHLQPADDTIIKTEGDGVVNKVKQEDEGSDHQPAHSSPDSACDSYDNTPSECSSQSSDSQGESNEVIAVDRVDRVDRADRVHPPSAFPSPTALPPTSYQTSNTACPMTSSMSSASIAAELSMELNRSLTFDLDSLLASGPARLDPGLVPELLEEQLSLVQDLDSPTASISVSVNRSSGLRHLRKHAEELSSTEEGCGPATAARLLDHCSQMQAAVAVAGSRWPSNQSSFLAASQTLSGHAYDTIMQQMMMQSFQLGQMVGRASLSPSLGAAGMSTNASLPTPGGETLQGLHPLQLNGMLVGARSM